MNLNKASFFSVLANIFIFLVANGTEQEDFVYVLNSQNFDKFIAENEFVVGN